MRRLTTMRLHLLYVHSTALGYARYGVKLATALERAGVTVDDQLDPSHKEPANVACWISTPSHATGWFAGQHTVISTMWEATVLPEAFRENLHNFAQVLVPSEHNLELFSRYHPNVDLVPLGVDTREWEYRERIPPRDRFIFLIGGSGPRKGVDLAYKAFRKLWPTEGSWPRESPRPCLVFKSPRPIDWYGPRIEHVGGKLTDQAERDLYAMAHCYLQPSRGEGWGLQPLQAIAQGCPTILTDAHGHKAFSHLGYPLGHTMSKADYFIYGDAGQWWEPSLDDLCQQMEYVYNNYDEACEFAQMASTEARKWFNWDRTADHFIQAVGKHQMSKPYAGTRGWVRPDLKYYAVAVNKPWRAEVAGTVYQFKPGETTYEPADVKRILFEAGILDPACIVTDPNGPVSDIETGLTVEQIAKIGAYSASHKHCWECGQVLNDGVRYEPELV